MKQIYIFTENYHDALAQKMPGAAVHNFGGLDCLVADGDGAATALAEVAAQALGADTSQNQAIKAKLKDFLSENEYIHLDAFIRICLEDVNTNE